MQYRKLTEIKKFDNNPRYIKKDDMEKLVTSIKNNPDYFEARPIILSNRTGELIIIAGNQRYEAAKIIGLTEVPTYLLKDLSEEREKEIMIRDNVSNGEWDWELLSSSFEKEELEDWGLDIDKWKEDDVIEDEVPEVTENPISKLGEVYQLGRHRIMCGDSTKIEDVEKLMDGKKADMVFTDPPYNIDYVGKTKEALKIQNDKSSLFEFRNMISKFIDLMVLNTKKGGVYYVCMPLETGVTDLFLEKTHLQSVIIWLKNIIVMGRKDYQQKTEPILFMTNESYTEESGYRGIIYGWNFGDSHDFFGGRKQSNVWEFDRPSRSSEHPTTKPINLIAKAIRNSSVDNNLVLDLFLGSGSTLIACKQTNRICYGMEIDPKYIDVIRKRYAKFINSEDWESATPKIL